MQVMLADGLRPVLRLGVLRLFGMIAPADRKPIDAEMAAFEAALAREHAGKSSGQVPGTDEARRLYKSVGIDPTKTRPSSEALLRRVLKGEPLYRIHPLVDLFNLASLASLLPVGLYDESKIAGGAVTVQIGLEGWGFEGIRKGRVDVAGRLCVSDAVGPFGSPTSDSLRTSVEGAVPAALAVFFQPADGDDGRMARALDFASELAARHLGARVAQRYLLS